MGYYDVLGVATDASDVELRQAYLALARVHHPDRLADATAAERRSAEARMAQINEAWSVLSDHRRRAAYDRVHLDGSHAPSRVHDADTTFRPFDLDDDPDPLDLDDTPLGPPTLTRRTTLVPAWLGIASFVCLVVGAGGGLGPVFVLGLALAGGAALAFLVLPLIALSRSARRDR